MKWGAMNFQSAREMFEAYQRDTEGFIQRASVYFEVSSTYVEQMINHLVQKHWNSPQAHMYLIAELGLYKRSLSELERFDKQFDLRGKSVLDVGCAGGHALRALEKLGASIIVGLDSDPGRISSAKKTLADHGCNAHLINGSMNK